MVFSNVSKNIDSKNLRLTFSCAWLQRTRYYTKPYEKVSACSRVLDKPFEVWRKPMSAVAQGTRSSAATGVRHGAGYDKEIIQTCP